MRALRLVRHKYEWETDGRMVSGEGSTTFQCWGSRGSGPGLGWELGFMEKGGRGDEDIGVQKVSNSEEMQAIQATDGGG